jgi:hypothetical protein
MNLRLPGVVLGASLLFLPGVAFADEGGRLPARLLVESSTPEKACVDAASAIAKELVLACDASRGACSVAKTRESATRIVRLHCGDGGDREIAPASRTRPARRPRSRRPLFLGGGVVVKDVCALNLDADVVAKAMRAELPEAELVRLREHFASCGHCAKTARALERVKLAWTDAVSETPFLERARDARAMRRFVERASNGRRKAFGGGLVIGLAAAAAITLVVVRRTGGELAAVTKPPASTALASNGAAAANAPQKSRTAPTASSSIEDARASRRQGTRSCGRLTWSRAATPRAGSSRADCTERASTCSPGGSP